MEKEFFMTPSDIFSQYGDVVKFDLEVFKI